ncbi:MAG: cupredoxin domain-containing protein [Candidatus Paceibacterota bacterium]|jgi:plastocyanin domain-containing protein
MNKTALAIVTLGLVVFMGVIFMGGSGSGSVQNVEIKNGIQYIKIDAKGGYSPKVSTAKAGIPTKLIVATNGTFDCSASLVIHSVNFQKILPQTGETEIDIGIPKAGEPFSGVCGMGMYGFKINFEN